MIYGIFKYTLNVIQKITVIQKLKVVKIAFCPHSGILLHDQYADICK